MRPQFPGGMIGRVHSSDPDSYDTLTYAIANMNNAGNTLKATSLFNISKDDGSLYAFPNLDSGEYTVNVTVSDNKFVSSTIVTVNVEIISEEMLQNAVSIRLQSVSPKDFIQSKKKSFIRAIKDIMQCRAKDIILISVQNARENTSWNKRHTREADTSVDVLFAIRKSKSSHENSMSFYTPKEIQKAIEDLQDEFEDITHLKIVEVINAKCLQHHCMHGECEDKVYVDTKTSYPVFFESFSFASAKHELKAECTCKAGYGGEFCQLMINECARDPCKLPKLCKPDKSERGYTCTCKEGFFGNNCDRETSKCNEDSCYVSKNPVTFTGKGYANYRIDKNQTRKKLEEQTQVQMRIRTVQLTGTLMYAAGKIDFMILEIQNGIVQLRYNLGSGEGLVSVASVFVSDGLWHEIRMEREGSSARLIIDGKHTKTGVSPGINGILNVQSHDIYFGAEVRPHPSVIGIEDTQRGFIGCMDDLVLSREALSLLMNTPFTSSSSTSTSTVVALKRFANVEFNCQPSNALVPLSVCKSQNLCQNGGTCRELNHGKDYECLCHDRFDGRKCEEDRVPCASSPCLYGGKCLDEGFGNYTCECPAKMSGKRCDFGRFCLPNPCRNSGVCEEGDDGPICMCRGE